MLAPVQPPPGKPGKVFLLGAGPGDPELITVRARRRLAEADLVLYDALVHPDLLALCKPGAEQVFVGKRAGRVSERQGDINARMVEAARAGRMVARLKGGDPYLFGRGSEEAEHLRAAGIEVEVVPGVPSAIAAATHTGISLTHRDLASSIAYVTATESPDKDGSAHDWSKLATATQTLVIFMGVRKLAQLMQVLIANGRSPDCPAAVVQSASLPNQRVVVGTVATLPQLVARAGIGMPALTIVGEVVRLRESLRWFDLAPLFGKRVLVTRAREQSASLCQLLRDQGAEPVLMPAITIAPPADPALLARAVTDARLYRCIAFSSENGVEAFFSELARQGRDARALGAAKVAAIGPGTADRLLVHGVRPDLVPTRHVGEALADAILASFGTSPRGARVLLPRAAAARDALPGRLRDEGVQVDDVPAYRTLGPDPGFGATLRARIEARELDAITFTSASTVEHTVQALEALSPGGAGLLSRLTVASIGPITTEAATRLSVRVDATADPHTLEGLVDALCRACKEKT
jgi:uroporphyrinogen III methyltransferase/synthase